eukprot:4252328-Amphidinium_carterae.1
MVSLPVPRKILGHGAGNKWANVLNIGSFVRLGSFDNLSRDGVPNSLGMFYADLAHACLL